MDNNNEMNLSEATEALCTAESAVESMDEMIKLFGVFDENLKVISAETGARIIAAGDCIRIEGSAEAVELAKTDCGQAAYNRASRRKRGPQPYTLCR